MNPNILAPLTTIQNLTDVHFRIITGIAIISLCAVIGEACAWGGVKSPNGLCSGGLCWGSCFTRNLPHYILIKQKSTHRQIQTV